MQVPPLLTPGNADVSYATWLFSKSEKHYNLSNQVLANTYSVYSLTRDHFSLPERIHSLATIISYFGLGDMLFFGPRFFRTIETLRAPKDLCSLANALLMVASEVSNLASLFSLVVEGLKAVHLCPRDRFTWTDKLTTIFMPLQVIYMGQAIEQAHLLNHLRQDFQARYPTPEAPVTLETRVHNVVSGLLYVEQQADSLQSALSLSKKCRLSERSHYLLQRLTLLEGDKTPLVHEGERFLEILKASIRTRTTLEVINTIINIASTLLSLAALTLPAMPLTAALLTATTVAGVALAVFDALLVDKNPFKPKESLIAKRLINPLRHTIYDSATCIYLKIGRAAATAIHGINALLDFKSYIDDAEQHIANDSDRL